MSWFTSVLEAFVRKEELASTELAPSEYLVSRTSVDPSVPLHQGERQGEELKKPLLGLSPSDSGHRLSSIFEAFDSSQPVQDQRGLYGRDEQLLRLMNGILFRRHHGVISGPRGSGKTSMVKVFGEGAEEEGLVVLYSANDSDAPFGLMMRQLLERIPPSSLADGEAEAFRAKVEELGPSSSAQQVISILSQLVYSAVLIIIDEFDRAPSESFKAHVSSLLKLSSDARLKVRFLLVGDERTLSEVVKGHASLGRHTTHVSTSPLPPRATASLLDGCADAVGLRFSDLGRKVIVQSVCGSPYHARLFGMHAALRANSNKSEVVGIGDAVRGLRDAFDEWASLNPDDAELFMQLIVGTDADLPLIDVAVQLAWRKLPELASEDQASKTRLQMALDKLSPAIDKAGGGISFKDATAAQFLIALHIIKSRDVREFIRVAKERSHH